MLQGWLKLTDAEWAAWTRAPSVDALWMFGLLGGLILIGLVLFAWGAARRRWRGVVAGLVLAAPCAALAAIFLQTSVQERRTHARCVADGGVRAAGQQACSAHGAATLIHVRAEADGFEGTQYYWTADGLCLAEVARGCAVHARPVAMIPTPGMEHRVHP